MTIATIQAQLSEKLAQRNAERFNALSHTELVNASKSVFDVEMQLMRLEYVKRNLLPLSIVDLTVLH